MGGRNQRLNMMQGNVDMSEIIRLETAALVNKEKQREQGERRNVTIADVASDNKGQLYMSKNLFVEVFSFCRVVNFNV